MGRQREARIGPGELVRQVQVGNVGRLALGQRPLGRLDVGSFTSRTCTPAATSWSRSAPERRKFACTVAPRRSASPRPATASTQPSTRSVRS